MNGLKLEQIYFLFKIPNVLYFFILKMKVSELIFIQLIAALSEEKCRTFNNSFKFSNNQMSDVDKSVLCTRSRTTLNCRLLITMNVRLRQPCFVVMQTFHFRFYSVNDYKFLFMKFNWHATFLCWKFYNRLVINM